MHIVHHLNYQLVSQDGTKLCILFIPPLYIDKKIVKSKKRKKAKRTGKELKIILQKSKNSILHG
ncbi:hypothetical protein LguiB_016839 [Lonicera macranthoides]